MVKTMQTSRANSRGVSSSPNTVSRLLDKLRSIKLDLDARDPAKIRVPQRDLASILCNLAMMTRSGLSLPKALDAMSRERALQRYSWMLQLMKRRIEQGESFSRTLALFPRTFSSLVVQQIRVGERTGDMACTLERIAEQAARRGTLRRQLVKRLSYPALVAFSGMGLVIFMMTVVVPQFEEVYADSSATLPWATVFVSGVSRALYRYGWVIPLFLGAVIATLVMIRRHAELGVKFDAAVLRLPVVGGWLRDYAVLQFMDSMGTMIESGFVPLEAIQSSLSAIGNRAVRESVGKIRRSLIRGGRLSDELNRTDAIFPPTVSQLMTVGEATGDLVRATQGVRDLLERKIKDRMDATLGVIEPALTVLLAVLIGFIVLAIYLPMFGMIDALE